MITLSLGASPARGANAGLTNVSVTDGMFGLNIPTPGKIFYKAQFYITYSGNGSVILSGNSDGTGDTVADDVVIIKVKNKTFTYDYSNNCSGITTLPPQDITNLFTTGLNKVTVTLKDKCGGDVSSESMWITQQ
jgi:hypothetical protein